MDTNETEEIYERLDSEPERYLSIPTESSREGYFPVTKIQPGKLWLKDYSGQEGKIGPVFVSDEISSLCKVGWMISLKLGKTRKGWEILESGNVYPK
jgi:hypothetical protein